MYPTKILLAAPVVAVGAIFASAAPATADTGGNFATIYSLTDGPCAAQVRSSVHSPAYPNAAGFTVETTMLGVDACHLDVTLNWRNIDTGETGAFTQTANGPGMWMTPGRSHIFYPGFGRFVGTVSIGPAHFPESGEVAFTVEPYHD
ncbi:hypothetical protein DFR70_102942 [Nocardia tenerifensis]|uniref:Allene oxide cyclase barrel-like domain-containing protein n=1 Tax=Nocardia tenerifensis TaxID=228006 RepID=A0A318K8N2_9NOCA|nr:hypothetical protein [Nocardia tenerifensis]PXX69253.1 hypothetical protein DFR70_102942 [Nocardia tenerifensis]